MKRLCAWAQQPTSVAGFATVFGAVSALMTQQLSWMQTVPLIAGALVSIALPDNTQAKAGAEALASGIVTELTIRKDKT